MTVTLAIGWDVGGWLGRKQAVAVAVIQSDGSWSWVGRARTFNVAQILEGGVEDLARIASPDLESSSDHRIVLAIDAPLSFPDRFVRMLAGETLEHVGWAREIDNPLAYRDCDRHVAATYGKKPLSASFDKLGNNATVAMTMTRRWRAQGFRVLPFDAPDGGGRVVIEAYPALFKRAGVVVERARALLPDGLVDGSDEKDAAICALTAVAYAGATDGSLPRLVPPPSRPTDGWIFGPEPSWLQAER